jgi:hypothetical protein
MARRTTENMASFIESTTSLTYTGSWSMIMESSLEKVFRRVAADQCVAIPLIFGAPTPLIRRILDGFALSPAFYPVILNSSETMILMDRFGIRFTPCILVMALTGYAVIYQNDSVDNNQRDIWRTCWGGGRRLILRDFVKNLTIGENVTNFEVLFGNFTGGDEYVKLAMSLKEENSESLEKHIESLRKLIVESTIDESLRHKLSERVVIIEMLKLIREVEVIGVSS